VTELVDRRRQLLWVGLAISAMLPGVVARLSGAAPPHVAAAALFGTAIVGAAFVLSWAAEVVQLDISAGLALALLALIAVLPEYAVDFVFTHKAGVEYAANPAGPYQWAPLALANMTGGNQLLIGAGWPLVVLLGTWRIRRTLGPSGKTSVGSTAVEVALEPAQAVDIAYLTLATVYGLTLPLRHTLTLFDALVLVGIYVFYLRRLSRAPAEEPHLVGPAAVIALLPTRRRRALNIGMFAAAAGVILLCAEPFAESLVAVGEQFGISTFLLVKWLAPLASEAPELLVAGLFAWRLAPYVGLGALVSSKVNQWTLLVGTLPVVFAIAAGGVHGLPLDALQRDELLVTASQSVFAVAVLASRSMSRTEAWVMLTMFVAQLLSSGLVPSQDTSIGRVSVGVVFLIAAGWVLRRDIGAMRSVLRDGFAAPYADM
jgi:cation:H+ antiporter